VLRPVSLTAICGGKMLPQQQLRCERKLAKSVWGPPYAVRNDAAICPRLKVAANAGTGGRNYVSSKINRRL
jgi:hypothetical protein